MKLVELLPDDQIDMLTDVVAETDPNVLIPVLDGSAMLGTLTSAQLWDIRCPTSCSPPTTSLEEQCAPEHLGLWLEHIEGSRGRMIKRCGHAIRMTPYALPIYIEELSALPDSP
jgi:hypothetical protein